MIVLTIVVSYFLTSILGHILHWSLHQPWMRGCHVSHMTHHLKLYPATDFNSSEYRVPGKDSTTLFFLLVAIPLVLTPITLAILGIISWTMVIVGLATLGVVGFLNNYLHDSFHIKDHWLTKVPLLQAAFGHWVKLHWLHHVDMRKNYGIFTFHWDRVFSSFKKEL